MIERLIFTALKQGVDELVANPKRLELFFKQQHQLTTAEIDAIRTYFLANPPIVQHSYPRLASVKFPLYAIVLDEERESTKFLNDDAGMIDFDEAQALANLGLEGSFEKVSLWSHDFSILVLTDHQPDTCLYLYSLAKYFLVRERDYFKTCGVLDMTLSGSDVQPDQAYERSDLFVRKLSLKCLSDHVVIRERAEGRIRSVDGIFVDGGSDSDNGGVLTQVTGVVDEFGG